MVSINNSTSGAEAHLPFGGNGKSGNGSRQSGIWVLDQFTRWQSVNWDYSGRLQKAQMDIRRVDPGHHVPALDSRSMHPLDSYFRDSLTADLSDSVAAIAATESDKSAWWWGLFEAQATSRHLDFVARELQQEGRGFYTIGSAGHESNAMVAMAPAADRSGPAALPLGWLLRGQGAAGARDQRRFATCCRG